MKATKFFVALGEKKQDLFVARSHLASFSFPFDPIRLKSGKDNRYPVLCFIDISLL